MDIGNTKTLKDIKIGRTKNTVQRPTIQCRRETKITVRRTIMIMTS
jgi:hypothetical protein